MFGRLFWMGVGAFGALWGRRKVVRTVQRYVPQRVLDNVTRSVKSTVNDLAKAQSEAKQAMHTRESELRDVAHQN